MNDAVVIAGAGPAGLMLAGELGLAGVRAIVLERDPTPAAERLSPGTTVHARTVDLFQCRGLMDAVDALEPVVWPRVHFSNIWFDLMPMIEQEYSLIVMQAETEKILAARAVELGAEIRRGHQITGLAQDAEGVTVQVAGPDGGYQLRGRYLVGCDGRYSVVRELAGISAPRTGGSWYGLTADFEIGEDEEWEWSSPTYPLGLCMVSPHPGNPEMLRMMTMEWGVEGPGDEVPPTAEELAGSARRVTGSDHRFVGSPVWIHRYGGTTSLADRYRAGNVFIAGDAAHFHYFGAGHGMNTSLHDAANLGWKLAADIQGWAAPGLLDTYEAERRPVGRRACVFSEASLTLAYPAEHVAALREVVEELMTFEDAERRMITYITDVRYPMSSAGSAEDAGDLRHPLLGRPVPQVRLDTEAGQTHTAEALRSGRGVLYDLSGGVQDLSGVAAWSAHVDVVTARPTEGIDATALLVRPDGFVAWADSTGRDIEGLAEALGAWFGPGVDGLTGELRLATAQA